MNQAAKWQQGAESNPSESNSATSNDTRGNLTEELCCQLAESVRERFGANIGLAFGVYPTVIELAESSRVFEVVYAISLKTEQGKTTQTEKRSLAGHPEVVTARVAKTALDLVRRKLISM